MANPGDQVKIITTDESLEGVLMPSHEKEVTIIKLESGYNLGISTKKIKSVNVISEHKTQKLKKQSVKINKDLPTISILHTGGTIASKVDYKTGGVNAEFTPEELLLMFPEIKDHANINSRLIKNMWSEDMRFSHYNIMAKEIEKEVKSGVDGIILTQGTDTLHYTSAALKLMLDNLPIPVLVVGSQRSSDRSSSDAKLNLLSAILFISKTDFADVGICMHASTEDEDNFILPALKSRKMHSSRRDAFRPINSKPYAKVNYNHNKIHFLNKDYNKRSKSKVSIKLFKEKIKVAILKAHPNMYKEQFDFFKNYDGLVLEGFGISGNLPINENDELTKEHGKIEKSLKTLSKNTVLATSTQCIYGRIDMNVYSTGRKMIDLGICGNYHDMTPETTFIKLAWLLSNYKKDEVPKLMETNLKGEISDRIEIEEFLY